MGVEFVVDTIRLFITLILESRASNAALNKVDKC